MIREGAPSLRISIRSMAFGNGTMSSQSQLDHAYTTIREMIESGEVRPGQMLSRRKLAEQIGVSPTVVQLALAQLDREGVTESRPRSGTYVRELTAEEFLNLCEVRELVEPYAAACAAERITPEQIAYLWESCRRYQELTAHESPTERPGDIWLRRCQRLREEMLFHGTILKASGNPFLANLVSTLQLIGQVGPRLVFNDNQDNENSPIVTACEHEGIVQALESHDAELARQRMFNHISGARILVQKTKAPKSGTSPHSN